MKLRLAIISLIILAITSCKKNEDDQIILPPRPLSSYTINVNDSILFSLLEQHADGGYAWSWVNKATSKVLVLRSYTTINTNDSKMMGSPITSIWKIKGIKIGVDTIKLYEIRPNTEGLPVDSLFIVVKVK